MASDVPPGSVVLARDFFTLQEERVRQYAVLNTAHRAYLATAPSYNMEAYQTAVADATKNFKELSERIIEMRNQFDSDFKEKVRTGQQTTKYVYVGVTTMRFSDLVQPRGQGSASGGAETQVHRGLPTRPTAGAGRPG